MRALPSPALRERALDLFRAIGHEDRLVVLLALAKTEQLCVGDLAELCGASQSGMSHQLRTLRQAGLVRATRRGKQIFYTLHDKHVARIVQDAVAHVKEKRRGP